MRKVLLFIPFLLASTFTVNLIKDVDYVSTAKGNVTVNDINTSEDKKITVTKYDKDFGYELEREIYSEKKGVKIIIRKKYTPFYRDGILVGKWHNGETVSIYKVAVSSE